MRSENKALHEKFLEDSFTDSQRVALDRYFVKILESVLTLVVDELRNGEHNFYTGDEDSGDEKLIEATTETIASAIDEVRLQLTLLLHSVDYEITKQFSKQVFGDSSETK